MLNSVILVFANKQDMVRQQNLTTILNVHMIEYIGKATKLATIFNVDMRSLCLLVLWTVGE